MSELHAGVLPCGGGLGDSTVYQTTQDARTFAIESHYRTKEKPYP